MLNLHEIVFVLQMWGYSYDEIRQLCKSIPLEGTSGEDLFKMWGVNSKVFQIVSDIDNTRAEMDFVRYLKSLSGTLK